MRLTGWLLLFTALLGILTAVALLTQEMDGDSIDMLKDLSGEGRMAGRITDGEGQPLYEVNLTVTGTEWYTLTDGNGEYHLDTVPAGKQNLSLSKAGYETLYYHTFIVPDEGRRLNLQLEQGSGYRLVQDPKHRDQLGQAQGICAVTLGILVCFTALGAYRAFQGRDFAWVAGGALMGIFTFGFGLGSLLSLIALYLAIKYRRAYIELERG